MNIGHSHRPLSKARIEWIFRNLRNSALRRPVLTNMKLTPSLMYCVFLCASVAMHAQRRAPEIALQPLHGGFLSVHATMNGHEGTFLLDSGSGVSNITPEFAHEIGCKPWGQITGIRMTGQRLDMQRCDHVLVRFGAYRAPSGTIGVFDLSKVLPPSMRNIDGTIALDVFAAHIVRFSYAHHTLQILDPDSSMAAPAGRHSMPIHLVRDAEGMALTVNLPVVTDQGTAWFELDSGNTSPWVLVGKHLAADLHLDPTLKAPQPVHLTLADGTKFSGSARLLDLILDGNLGTSFLDHYDVTLDLVHARAWVAPVAKQATPN